MNEQIGLRGWYERLKIEAPQWSKTLPQLPRLVHNMLAERHHPAGGGNDDVIRQILLEQKRTNRLLQGLLLFGVAVGIGAMLARAFLALAYGG
jgi:ubiquinone biosynthesis protein